jgi:NTP pyrophosphatase (non-canonical NTP hydrolase)
MITKFLNFINGLYPFLPERQQRFSENFELTHAVLGLAGETGEVVDIIKKDLAYGKPQNKEKLTEEMGDLFHYFMRVADLSGISFDEIVENNMSKLSKRYPNGYTNSDAINKTETKGNNVL